MVTNASSTFNWNEAVAGITLVTTMEGGLSTYAGILVDDFSIEEYTETSLPAVNAGVKPLTVNNRNLVSNIAGQLELYSVSGSHISTVNISENQSVSVAKGLFIARLISANNTYIQKLIVD